MEFDIRDGKLIKCIPDIPEQIIVEDGKKLKVSAHEIEIEIPASVNTVHKDAFSEIESYVEVIRFTGDSLSFSDWAPSPFRNCKMLKEVVFSDGLEEIPPRMFKGKMNLEKVTLPPYLTWIGREAFKNCSNLKEANIPMGLKFIGESAFESCTKLKCDVLDPATEIDISAFIHTDIYVYPAENMSISFGRYYQGLYGAEKTPVIWRQIGKQDDDLLFISDKCLEYMYFDGNEALSAYRTYYGSYKTKWEDCSLRTWLNDEFLEEVFMPDERSLLQKVNGDSVSILTHSQFSKVNWFGHSLSRCSEYVLNKKKKQKGYGKIDTTHEEPWFLQDDRNSYYDKYGYIRESYGEALKSPEKNSDLNGWINVNVAEMLCVRPIIMLKASDAEKYMIEDQ